MMKQREMAESEVTRGILEQSPQAAEILAGAGALGKAVDQPIHRERSSVRDPRRSSCKPHLLTWQIERCSVAITAQ